MAKYKVLYSLPGESKKREIIVEAKNQEDAKKVGQAQLPGATIKGGPQKV